MEAFSNSIRPWWSQWLKNTKMAEVTELVEQIIVNSETPKKIALDFYIEDIFCTGLKYTRHCR